MRTLLLLLLSCGFLMGQDALPSFERLVVNGKAYQAVKVVAVEPSGIRFMHSTGAGRALFQDLEPEVRGKFKFDPVAAEAHVREMAAKEKAGQEQIAAAKKKQQDLDKVATNEMVLADIVDVQVDRFTQETTVKLKLEIPVTEEVEVRTYAVWGKDEFEDPHFFLIFSRTGSGWKWLGSEDAGLLIDGTPKLMDVSLNTKVLSAGDVFESFSISLTAEEARAIFKANAVAFKIGIDEYDLPPRCVKPMGVPYAYWWTKKKKQDVLSPATTGRE